MGRFKHLVDTEEGMKSFRAKYNIPPHVGVRYAAQGGVVWWKENSGGGHPYDCLHRGRDDHSHGYSY